jgi:hypothetical protein
MIWYLTLGGFFLGCIVLVLMMEFCSGPKDKNETETGKKEK